LALFIALGGTSYAATQLPRDSVGTGQIRDSAVTLRKVDGRAQRALAGNPFPRVLPAGKTIKGAFAMSDYKQESDAFQEAETGISFGFALAKAPVPHFPAAADPAHCPGTPSNPQARPGHLCVYEDGAVNVASREVCSNNVCAGVAGRTGAWIFVTPAGVGYYSSRGTWAVTSPD